ncbi:MAG: WXG100 family type VII secretion target [Pseudonocardiaceae bacterium]
MSGDGYHVDLAQLAGVIERLDKFDQFLERALEQADQRVNQLHGSWTGEAAAAHLAAHQEWKRGAAEMRAGSATMRSITSTAHSNYTSAVNTNQRMWAQVV